MLEKKNKGRCDYISLYIHMKFSNVLYIYMYMNIYEQGKMSFINAMIYVENQKESPALKVLREK